MNNSTTNNLVNSYSNFLTLVYVVHNGENGEAHRG